MRISDWSSDVCSSDLVQEARAEPERHGDPQLVAQGQSGGLQPADLRAVGVAEHLDGEMVAGSDLCEQLGQRRGGHPGAALLEIGRAAFSGTSVSVRVVLGGRRIITKKK